MNPLVNHLSFELGQGVRDKSLLLMNYLFPLGFFVLMGLLMTDLNPEFHEVLIPAMITFSIMASMLLGLPTPLVSARETGVLRSFRVNGVPTLSILALPGLTTAMHMVVVAVIIVVTAPLFFGAPLPDSMSLLVLGFLAMAFNGAGLGALIGVISANSRATVLWSQLVFLPSMLLGGLMLPSSALPETLAPIGALLPSTYAMSVFSGTDALASLLVLVTGGAVAFWLAHYLFAWDDKNRPKGRPLILGLAAIIPYLIGSQLIN